MSGSGNVALHAAQKAIASGGRVVTLSDSDGWLHAPDGIDADLLQSIKQLKLKDRGRLSTVSGKGLTFHKRGSPWSISCDVAMPCATQNELNEDDAVSLIQNGVGQVVEGANMPSTPGAVAAFRKARIGFGPAKAANAGGVAVSGLEMAQNAARLSWDEQRLSDLLSDIMGDIHERCVADGDIGKGRVDYLKGANVAGFRKVADAMVAYGLV